MVEDCSEKSDHPDLHTWKGQLVNAWHYLLFMLMGSGANWVFSTALAQEIPYFENILPEELCIATYMNATTNVGVFVMAAYVYYNEYVYPIPFNISVPVILAISTVGCFLSAGVYGINAGGVSYMLYLCCAIGGCVGALSSVIMNPFMTQYENQFISAGRSGGSALIFLCALLALAQDPGSEHERFSTTVYLCIFGILMLLPILAYAYIRRYAIGLRPKQRNDEVLTVEEALAMEPSDLATSSPSPSDPDQGGVQLNPLVKATSLASEEASGDLPTSSPLPPSTPSPPTPPSFCPHLFTFLHPIERTFTYFIDHYLISEEMHTLHPWLRATIPYMCTVGWINFNTWGIITAIMPFAMSNVSPGSGSESYAIGLQIAAFCLVCGDYSTTFFALPIFPALLLFTSCCFIIYLAAMIPASANLFDHTVSPIILIILYALERYLEAHVVTTAYRAVATKFPRKYRSVASSAVGVMDQVSTTTGALVSTLIVSFAFSCTAGTDDGQ